MPNAEDRHRFRPGSKIDLHEVATSAPRNEDKDDAERELATLKERLFELQERLYAEGKHKVLVVFQGLDGSGKNSATNHVFSGVNPEGVHVTAFKVPTAEELAHDYLWRIHRAVPGKGQIGIFNRSHYEDVLVVRVDDIVPPEVWRERYEQINQFEKLLADTGTTILKFYLHLSKDEQKKRFESRIEKPEKRWKFSLDDLRKRAQWDAYLKAYDDVLERCSTDWAPWYVIPADDKWYRNLAVARVIVAALEALDPRFPEPDEPAGGWDHLVVE
jgi:PPK2 family polyphosphate:nucleotide phosphotransferase